MRYPYFVVPTLFLLAGCSNHPLQDDVTGYTTHQIMQKLRCEAQFAVLEHLKARSLARYQEIALDISRKIRKYQELRANYNSLFEKIDKKNETNLLASKINEKERADLGRAGKKLSIERRKLEELLAQADEKAKAALAARIVALHEREIIVTAKVLALNVELEEINAAIKDAEKAHNIVLEPLGISQKIYVSDKEAAEIVDKALSASIPESASLNKIFSVSDPASLPSVRELFAINRTTLSMKLDFKITENNNAITDGTLTWPIRLGSVSLGYKAGKEKARVAQRVVHITSTFQELSDRQSLPCSNDGRDPDDKWARTYPISGNVGVGELIKQYFDILKAATIVAATGQDTFTDNLAFTTKISGRLNPTIEIKPVHPSLVKAGLDLNADRTDLHQVALQVRPYSPPSSPSDPKLHITKIPSVTVNITEGPDGHGSSIGVR